MFSIFVALFGGLYFAGRRAYEKSLSDKHDSDFRMGQINKALMVNRKFEDELVKKIADPHYREEIEALVKEDLQCIYGDAWKELFAGDWYEPRAYTTSFGSKEDQENTPIVISLQFANLKRRISSSKISG